MDTNGYTDDSDNPGWITETNGGTETTTRYESTIGGDLGLTITGTDIKIGLRNPHQDIVSTITIPATGDAEGIDSWANYDEYGNQTGTAPATGPAAYGWVGTNQRSTDASGLLLMGARLYNPATGLFTSIDPVAGGNTTDYAYPQDPINKYDINGKDWRDFWGGVAIVAGVIGAVACGVTIVCGVAVGAAAGAAYYVARNGWSSRFSWGGLGGATAWGAVGGLFRWGGGRGIGGLSTNRFVGTGSRLFGKSSGTLNRGPVRTGWGWKGTRNNGRYVFRTSWSKPGNRTRWNHVDWGWTKRHVN